MIFRFELVYQGLDYRSGDGFNLCSSGLRSWFEIPVSVNKIDFLVSRKKFEESIKIEPMEVDPNQFWLATEIEGTTSAISFYTRTAKRLLEISENKLHVGVEY